MTTIDALIERLRGMTGPDRDVDAHIAIVAGLAFGWCNGEDWTCGEAGCAGCGEPLGLSDERRSYPSDWRDDERLPLYTASVDAALAFTDRVLPGWRWGVSATSLRDGFYPDGKPKHVDGFQAHVTKRSALRPMPAIGKARTAPAAILLATLTALQQTEAQS